MAFDVRKGVVAVRQPGKDDSLLVIEFAQNLIVVQVIPVADTESAHNPHCSIVTIHRLPPNIYQPNPIMSRATMGSWQTGTLDLIVDFLHVCTYITVI